MRKALRIAIVWHGTVMEETVCRGGAITVGGSKSSTFHVPLEGDVDSHVLFTVKGESAELTPGPGMAGTVTKGGAETAVAGGSVSIAPGDWGLLHIGDVTVYFQWVDDDGVIAATGVLAAIDFNLASTALISATAHFLLLLAAFLFTDPTMQGAAFEIPDRFVRIMVDEPPDAIEEIEEEDMPDDETTSKAAGGEEGKFGEEDAEVDDSVLPDHDGPLVDELQTTELGAAMEAAIGATGALTNVFGSSDMMSNTFGQDFATAGEGDVFIVGRGVGGMGMRGTGRGGGGDGFGRVGGVGSIDTGGGRGQGAGLGRRAAQAPRARMSRGRPNVNGFLSREQIERVVRRHSRGIRYCYERQLADDPSLGGRISVNWTIDLDGRVSSASISENTMGERSVESCVLREVQRMRFDQPDGGMVVVTYPFTFRSEEG